MGHSGYWKAFMERQVMRRRLLQAGAVARAGLWMGPALGCSGGTTKKSAAIQIRTANFTAPSIPGRSTTGADGAIPS